MILFHKPKASFIHIRKTGGTSFKRWVRDNISKVYYEDHTNHGSMERFPCQFGSVFPKHLDYSRTMMFTNNKPGVTFTFVRNPWARLLSVYTFGLKRCLDDDTMTKETYDQLMDPTFFKMYALYVYSLAPYSNDKIPKRTIVMKIPRHNYRHGQAHLIGNPDNNLDFYCKLENIEEDFKKVQKLFNCFEPLGHHKKSNDSDYRDWYDDELVERLTPKLNDDMKTFGYEF